MDSKTIDEIFDADDRVSRTQVELPRLLFLAGGSSTCVLDTRSSASKISSIVFESILYLLSVYFSGKKPICYCTVEHFQRFAFCRVHEHRVLTEFFVHFNDHLGHVLLYYAPDEGKNPFPVAGNGDVGTFVPRVLANIAWLNSMTTGLYPAEPSVW